MSLKLDAKTTSESFSAANGENIRDYGCSPINDVQIGDWHGQVEDLRILELPTVDAILGIPWLRRENPMIDWTTSTVTFARPRRFHVVDKTTFKTDLRDGTDTYVCVVNANKKTSASIPSALLNEYSDLFPSELPSELPPSRAGVDHAIRLVPNAQIPYKRPYRLSHAENLELQRQVADLLAKGLITPSNSPYAAPVLFVRKKDGTFRMCIDYRALNDVTIKDRFPLPNIQDLLDSLAKARIFSKIDLRSGYNQVLVKPEDRHKTAFVTNEGQYEFNVLSFGLCNAPGTFQRMMNRVLEPFMKGTQRFVLVYLDDVIIFSQTDEEHQRHVREVLDALRNEKLYMNAKKCFFFQHEIEFLSHVVGNGKIQMDSTKIEAVLERPRPQNKTEVRSFLGLANYYRRFIKGYAKIVAPLNDLTSNNDFVWTEQHESAFRELKTRLTEAPVLTLPDFQKEFKVMTDASNDAVGAVLSQKDEHGRDHPVAYASQKLTPTERKYPTRDKELYALVFALKQWRTYLYQQKFLAETDHQSLTYIRTSKELTPRLARWNDFLAEYEFEIAYKPGHSNGAADAMSRPPTETRIGERDSFGRHVGSEGFANDVGNRSTVEGEGERDLQRELQRRLLEKQGERRNSEYIELFSRSVLAISRSGKTNTNRLQDQRQSTTSHKTPTNNHGAEGNRLGAPEKNDLKRKATTVANFRSELLSAYARDSFYKRINGTTITQYPNYRFNHGFIYLIQNEHARLCIPNECDSLIRAILHDFHEADVAGHPGVQRCYSAIREHYYWNRMFAQVEKYVRSCGICQRNKPIAAPRQAIRPLDPPDRRMSEISMDFVSGFDTLEMNSHDQVTVIVDRFTKKVLLYASRKTDTAAVAARSFIDNFVAEYGLPDKIISDRDTKFTASFWKELTTRLNVRLGMSTAFHPQTDGQTERTNRVLIEMLRTMGVAYKKEWREKLKLIQFNINNSISSVTGLKPFYAFAAFNPRIIDTHELHKSTMNSMNELADELDEIEERVQDELLRAQQIMYRTNVSNEPTVFREGEYVLLSTAHVDTFASRAIHDNHKLGPKFIGPFRITKMHGANAAALELPPGYRQHPTINTSYLRKFVFDEFQRSVPPDPEMIDGVAEFEVDYIVDERIRETKQNKRTIKTTEFLVVWTGYDISEASWEPEVNLENAQEKIDDFRRRSQH